MCASKTPQNLRFLKMCGGKAVMKIVAFATRFHHTAHRRVIGVSDFVPCLSSSTRVVQDLRPWIQTECVLLLPAPVQSVKSRYCAVGRTGMYHRFTVQFKQTYENRAELSWSSDSPRSLRDHQTRDYASRQVMIGQKVSQRIDRASTNRRPALDPSLLKIAHIDHRHRPVLSSDPAPECSTLLADHAIENRLAWQVPLAHRDQNTTSSVAHVL